MPNLKKSLGLFCPLARVRESLGFKSKFVIGPSNILFAGVYVCTFDSGNLTRLGSKGVKAKRVNCTHSELLSGSNACDPE